MSIHNSSPSNALGLSSINAYPPSQIQRNTSTGANANINTQIPTTNAAMGAPHIRPVNLPNSPYYTGLLTPVQSPYIANRNIGPGSPSTAASTNSNLDIHPNVLYVSNRFPTINYDISSSIPSMSESILSTPITLPSISNSIRLSYHVYSTSPSHQVPFPWSLTVSPVNASNQQIITINALFTQIHLSLTRTIVSDTEYRRFNFQEQQLARASYERRKAKLGSAANAGGLIRLDFLLGCTRFMGLRKGADGGLIIVLSDVGVSRN